MATRRDATTSAIGNRIHELRQQRKLSLRDVAAQSGLTASFLSQVERGMVNTSIESLRRITDSLNVSMAGLLESARPAVIKPAKPAKGHRLNGNGTAKSDRYSPVVRSGNRPSLHFPDPGVSYELLSSAGTRSFVSFLSTLHPGTEVPARPLPQATEQLIFVLEGAMRLDLLDLESHTLRSGDSMTFDGTRVLKFACIGNSPARVLFVIAPPVF